MERKLVKQGQNALTVTLPAQWLAQYRLRAGNTVDVTIQNEILLISTAKKSPSVSITIKAKSLDRWNLWQRLLAAYIDGHDEIIVDDPIEEAITGQARYLVGFVISHLDKKKAVYSNTVSTPTENISELMSRIRYQLLALTECFASGAGYKEVKEKERVLDANIYYTMRFLRKYSNMQKDYQRFLLCLVVESAADNVTEILKFNPQKHNRAAIIKAIDLFVTASYDEFFSYIQVIRKTMPKKTFADGLTYSVVETLYNVSGYISVEQWQ